MENSEESSEADCCEEQLKKVEDSGDSSEGNGLEEQVDKVNNSEELSEINEGNDFEKSIKASNTVAFCCAGDKLSDEDFSDMDEEGKSSFNDEEICINTSVSKSRKPIPEEY